MRAAFLRWTALFLLTLFAASRLVHAVRRHVWFDCPPHWPLSIFNPRGPHGLAVWVAIVLTALIGGLALRFLPRRGYPLPLIAGVGLALILLSNAIQGIPKGFYNPIAGGRAPEQYYHDARNVESGRIFLLDFAAIQPTLHTHARTHPPGAVLLFYSLARMGATPSAMAVVIAFAATLLSAPAFYRLARNLLGADPAFAGYGTLLYLLLPAVQIYYCATLDALVATLLLCAIALWSEPPTARTTLVASAFIVAASWLTFGIIWVFPALIALDALQKRWTRWLVPVLLLGAVYGCLRFATGFDYLLAGRTASALENPRGFRLLVEPISYGFTRLEDVSEILVFFGPILIGLMTRGIPLLRASAAPRRALATFAAGVGALLLLFLSGAFHTGETARACVFLYPLLLLPVLAALREASPGERTLVLALVLAQTIGMQSFGNFFW